MFKWHNRMRYKGGSKRLSILRETKKFLLLNEYSKLICQRIRGQAFDLQYIIIGTSPKVYMHITGDIDILFMIIICNNESRLDVVVAMKVYEEVETQIQKVENHIDNHIVELYQGTFENNIRLDEISDSFLICEGKDARSLYVSSKFEDFTSFK